MKILNERIMHAPEHEQIEYADCLLAKAYEKVLGKETNLQSIISNRINYSSEQIQSIIDKELEGFTKEDLSNVLERYYKIKNNRRLRENSSFNNDSIKNLIIKLLDIKDNDEVIDLGTGEGLFFQTIKNNNLNIKAKGVELSLKPYENSLIYSTLLDFRPEFINCNVTDVSNLSYDKGYIYAPLGRTILDNDSEFQDNNKFKKLTSLSWLFVDKLIEGLTDSNKFAAILSDSCLFRNHDDLYRNFLIENNYIESIIKLPTSIVFETNISMNIVIFSKNNKHIKFFDSNKYKTPSELGLRLNDLKVEDLLIDFNSDDTLKVDYKNLDSSNQLIVTKYLQDKIELKYSTILSDVVEINQGSQYTISYFKDKITTENTNYKILTSNDIVNNSVDYDLLLQIKEDEKLSKRIAVANDIVMTAKSSTIKTLLLDNEIDSNIVVTGGMFILRPNIDKINPVFLKMFLESNVGIAVIKTIQKGSVIPIINKSDLMNLEISCPPIEIQNEIVKDYQVKLNNYNELKIKLDVIEKELKSHYEIENSKIV